MGLKYDNASLPFAEQRSVAAFGARRLGIAPPHGGSLADHPEVTRVLSGHSSAYIVPIGEGDVALIDAGMEEDAGNLRATLEQLNLGASAVKAIFVTHGHIDHVAGLSAFPDATIYAHQTLVPYLTGKDHGEALIGRLSGRLPVDNQVPAEAITTVTDDQTITVGDTTARVFATPGHTDGSLSYLINGVLYIGDAAMFGPDGQLVIPPKMITAERERAHKSLVDLAARAEQLGVDTVVPSHTDSQSFAEFRTHL